MSVARRVRVSTGVSSRPAKTYREGKGRRRGGEGRRRGAVRLVMIRLVMVGLVVVRFVRVRRVSRLDNLGLGKGEGE